MAALVLHPRVIAEAEWKAYKKALYEAYEKIRDQALAQSQRKAEAEWKAYEKILIVEHIHVGAFRFPRKTDKLLMQSMYKKPAAHSWDAQLDMIKKVGAESLRRIEAKLKMPGKIAGHLKKKIVSELAELRKALVAGLTQAKEVIQSMLTYKAPGNGSSGHAAIQKHFDELWGAISRLGMVELTTMAYAKGLITTEVRDTVFSTNGTSSGVKAAILLSAIQEHIKTDPSAFKVFVEILRLEPAYQCLADKLTSDLLC